MMADGVRSKRVVDGKSTTSKSDPDPHARYKFRSLQELLEGEEVHFKVPTARPRRIVPAPVSTVKLKVVESRTVSTSKEMASMNFTPETGLPQGGTDGIEGKPGAECPSSTASSIPGDDEFRSDILQVRYKNHSRMIELMLNRSVMSPAFSDILLACENEVFHCHKLILAAASECLAQLIEKTTALTTNSQQVLLIPGVKATVLKNLLEFIYKGNVYVTEENIGDFIKIGKELKIQGLYVANVTPSSSTMDLDNMEKHVTSDGGKIWPDYRNNSVGPNYPSSAAEYLCTEIDETLPESTFASADSRTLTATSDISCDDDDAGDDDVFKPPRRRKRTQSISSKNTTQTDSSLNLSTSGKQDNTANVPRRKKLSSAASSKKNQENNANQQIDPDDTRGIIKIKKKPKNGSRSFLADQIQANLGVQLQDQSLEEQELFMRLLEMHRASDGGADLSTSAKDTSIGSAAGASVPSRPSKKRTASNVSSITSSSAQPAAAATDGKRPKRNESTTKPSKEERERNEEKMEAAIKMAMETHNVVRSANTYGVATSTLRGRLKKLGYCAPPKPTPSSSSSAKPTQTVKNDNNAAAATLPQITPTQN